MKLASSCSGCFAGLSCGTRIEIVNLLQMNKEMSVLEIAGYFHLAQPTITHHLQYLKDAGIIQSIKRGRKVYYSIHQRCTKKDCSIFE